jgi:hypothetical protein
VPRFHDSVCPLRTDALRATSACVHRFSEFHRENLGENSVVKAFLDSAITCAWPADPAPIHPGALDCSVVAQLVQMEANCADVQAHAGG